MFLILMENNNWSVIKSSSSATYIRNTLMPMAARAENYKNPPGLHPSEPNYLWLSAGTNFGITTDAEPAQHHQGTAAHLYNQLEDAGVTWKSYAQGISGTICPLSNSGDYVARHNPAVYFDDISNNNSSSSPRCIAHVRPYTQLAADLADGGSVARFNFIAPDLCHDMHGNILNFTTPNCNTITGNLIKGGDDFLAAEIPKIMASAAYQDHGAIFVTWDEGEGTPTSDGPIGMLVISSLAKNADGGYANNIAYDHSSTLRTMEEIFKTGPFLGGAATATDLSDLFTTFP